jgi:hypothetical protein
MDKVENLKKITLAIEAGTTADVMDLSPEYPEFNFIFGLAPEGMTPFEYELVDKIEGDEVRLRLKKNTLDAFLEHIHLPIRDLMDNRDEVYLKARILKVSSAGNREIIKAMAEMTAYGGGGCGCGCGCG